MSLLTKLRELSLKDIISSYIVRAHFDKPLDLKANIDINAPDDPKLYPLWFKVLCKFKLAKLFTDARIREHDYTLPLPQKWYDRVYKKPMTLYQRSRLLRIIDNNLASSEAIFLMKLRMEGINQHYKAVLYKIAYQGYENPYKQLDREGFGYEFGILASVSVNGTVQATISDILSNTEELMRSETMFLTMLRSVKSSFLLSLVLSASGYLFVVYTTLIVLGAEFSKVYGVLQPGYSVLLAMERGNIVPLATYVIATTLLIFTFFVLRLDEVLLLSVKMTREILLWFESMRFYTTLDIIQRAQDLPESVIFDRAIKGVEIISLRKFLLTKLSEVVLVSTSVIVDFMTSTQFFTPEDVNQLVDVQGKFDKGEFERNVQVLLRNKRLQTRIREMSDQEKMQAVQSAIIAAGTVFLTLVYTISDIQLLYASF